MLTDPLLRSYLAAPLPNIQPGQRLCFSMDTCAGQDCRSLVRAKWQPIRFAEVGQPVRGRWKSTSTARLVHQRKNCTPGLFGRVAFTATTHHGTGTANALQRSGLLPNFASMATRPVPRRRRASVGEHKSVSQRIQQWAAIGKVAVSGVEQPCWAPAVPHQGTAQVSNRTVGKNGNGLHMV